MVQKKRKEKKITSSSSDKSFVYLQSFSHALVFIAHGLISDINSSAGGHESKPPACTPEHQSQHIWCLPQQNALFSPLNLHSDTKLHTEEQTDFCKAHKKWYTTTGCKRSSCLTWNKAFIHVCLTRQVTPNPEQAHYNTACVQQRPLWWEEVLQTFRHGTAGKNTIWTLWRYVAFYCSVFKQHVNSCFHDMLYLTCYEG